MNARKSALSEVDLLRRYAGHADGRRYEEVGETVGALAERVEACSIAVEALGELSDSQEQVMQTAAALHDLVSHGLMDEHIANLLTEAAGLIDEAASHIDQDCLKALVETHEAAVEAVETYADTKEGDPYDGKKDDLESAWTDASSALDELADALDNAEGNAYLSAKEPAE